ncbi:hypothetical protein [Mucilaginibacter sp.]|uniref:hypothetical protein n=1 Tax=Mucilaginibacter sp. TaxID=1882438 RepID=UPI00326785F0
MTRQDEIERVRGNGTHVVLLGAGASIASTIKNSEKNGRSLPAMNNIIQVLGMEQIVAGLPKELTNLSADFEKFYSLLVQHKEFEDQQQLIEKTIYQYFSELELPDQPTIYDYLVLSLRPKDVIATFNWDPFLYQAFVRNGKFTKTPGILFLHGTVSLGYSKEDKRAGPAGYYSKATKSYLDPIKLLYPVEKKDYNKDDFIRGQWEQIVLELKKAERITVFGYRAPDSDVEAIELLQKGWGTPDERAMEQFELIDVREEQEVKQSWNGFIHSHHYSYSTSFFDSSIARHPRRSVESYRHWSQPFSPSDAFQDGNRVPDNFQTLDEMWDWYKPIVAAEEKFVAEIKKKQS